MGSTVFDLSAVLILAVFGLAVLTLLVADIRAHAKSRGVSLGDAGKWSLIWIGASLIFAAYLWVAAGADKATLFLTGYTLEKVLSVDNLIVFGSIFSYFRIPAAHQHRALHYGVIGAVVFRLVFVSLGIGSLALFRPWVEGILAALVAYSAWQMYDGMGSDSENDAIDHDARWYIRWTRKIYPVDPLATHVLFVRDFFTGKFQATRLLLCVVAIEICDIMFSFDSVPAVLAVTQDGIIVYSAMIFAIMGLRSLYFVLAALRQFLTHLDKAVLVVLGFVALKLALHATGLYAIGPIASLGVVITVLGIGVAASLAFPEKAEA